MSKYQETFINPRGPGDARPTALQIVEDEGLIDQLNDKVAFITGANQGIGLETARALHATGATVFLGVRDLEKGQQAVNDILSSNSSRGGKQEALHLVELSLDSLESVRSAAKAFLAKSPNRLNILILNAGVMAPPLGRTKDGFETQLGVNYLSHFLLFQLLKPALLASSTASFNSRVVALSSMGHRVGGVRFDDLNFEAEGSYDPWAAYGQSKTAAIYLIAEVERRYAARGLHALAVNPGGISTNLGQYLPAEYLKQAAEDRESQRYMKSPQQGAATTVWAAISKALEGRGARFLANCAEQGPAEPSTSPLSMVDSGYAPWAFDGEKAARLWKASVEMVGVQDDSD